MTKPELKTAIVKHLLNYLTKKPLLELNEQISTFYDEDPNGKKELNAAMDEVWDELVEKYNVEIK